MALVLTDYTSGDEVRAVLGVNKRELKDAQLALNVYLSGLFLDLKSIDPNLNELYATVKLLPEGDRTVAQSAFYEAVRLFATYSVASSVAGSLSLMAVKDVSDGKASMGRFAGDPWKAVIFEVRERLGQVRGNLAETYLVLVPGSVAGTVKTIFGLRAVQAASNPVTGE